MLRKALGSAVLSHSFTGVTFACLEGDGSGFALIGQWSLVCITFAGHMFPVDRLQLTVSEMMIDRSEFLESTVSTRRHDAFGPRETKMSSLASITVHRLRGRISLAATVVVALSFASSSFTALDTFDIDLGSIHRLRVKPSFPLSQVQDLVLGLVRVAFLGVCSSSVC